MKRVFVDSSVLFTAVNSPYGGSAKLFILPKIGLVTSNIVLTEVERNIRKKLQDYHLVRYFMLVEKMQVITQNPDIKSIGKAKKAIVAKDVLILACAKHTKAEILVTLDRKHFMTSQVASFLKPGEVMTPKMIIESTV